MSDRVARSKRFEGGGQISSVFPHTKKKIFNYRCRERRHHHCETAENTGNASHPSVSHLTHQVNVNRTLKKVCVREGSFQSLGETYCDVGQPEPQGANPRQISHFTRVDMSVIVVKINTPRIAISLSGKETLRRQKRKLCE